MQGDRVCGPYAYCSGFRLYAFLVAFHMYRFKNIWSELFRILIADREKFDSEIGDFTIVLNCSNLQSSVSNTVCVWWVSSSRFCASLLFSPAQLLEHLEQLPRLCVSINLLLFPFLLWLRASDFDRCANILLLLLSSLPPLLLSSSIYLLYFPAAATENRIDNRLCHSKDAETTHLSALCQHLSCSLSYANRRDKYGICVSV